jgi:hypothetical protein
MSITIDLGPEPLAALVCEVAAHGRPIDAIGASIEPVRSRAGFVAMAL